MYLKEKSSGDMVEVLGLEELVDPNGHEVTGRFHHGEELQEAESFSKARLVFPSGEALPRCWTDPDYKKR